LQPFFIDIFSNIIVEEYTYAHIYYYFLFFFVLSHLICSRLEYGRYTYSQEEFMINRVVFLLRFTRKYSIETCHHYWDLYSVKVMKGKQHRPTKPYIHIVHFYSIILLFQGFLFLFFSRNFIRCVQN
jgi:hypothetical protein